MSKRHWSHLTVAGALVVSAVAGIAPGAAAEPTSLTPQSSHTATVARISGATRIETAIAISQDAFTAADNAVLARSDVYADALAGAPLAADLGAPILLTPSAAVPDGVLTELGRLGVDNVYLLGGAAAISESAAQQLRDRGLNVVRVSGSNRFATADAIAQRLGSDAGGTVFLVEGADSDPARGWPDALSAAPYAAFLRAPILLTTTEELPSSTADALTRLAPSEIVIVGGTVAVSEDVESAVSGDGIDVRRLAGDSRYTTSAAVYDEAVTRGMNPAERWLATGLNYPDALAAAPAAAHGAYPLLLISPDTFTGTHAESRIAASFDVLNRVVLLGGVNAISEDVKDTIAEFVNPERVPASFCLTVLHNNDGESQLVDAGSGLESFGGIARFATRVFEERARATSDAIMGCDERGVLTVTSGDNFLAGPEFSASLEKGVPFYDSIAFNRIGYDAFDLGNHDFDFGPEVTADLIEGTDAVFLSSNLSFTEGSPLAPLADQGDIAPSTVVDVSGNQVGVIGLTTPALRSISSPGPNTVIDQDVAAAVDAQIDALQGQGVEIIVLISHLQNIEEDLALVQGLSDIDIVIAGGGDEVLAVPGELLVPGDETSVFGPYPMSTTTADGVNVPVVTTAGDYKYLGRLVTRFDASGNLLGVDELGSRMVRIAGDPMPDAVTPDATLVQQVVEPVEAYLADLADTVIGDSTVGLDGSRPNIRQQETNLGNLMADSLRNTAEQRAAEYGVSTDLPFVSVQNGGGIRNNNVIPAGDLTVLTTFDIAPFPNFVGAFDDVTPSELKSVLENGYAGVENASGRFAHISGMEVVVDITKQAQTRGDDGEITDDGDRVRKITVDGTVIYDADAGGYQVDMDTPAVTLATIDFLARGGDDYPFPPVDTFTTLGTSYQQSLRSYIESLGTIDASVNGGAYADGGDGRITIIE